MDYTVHGILQAKNSVVASLSLLQGSFLHRNWIGVSCIAGGFFTNWAIREALELHSSFYLLLSHQPKPSTVFVEWLSYIKFWYFIDGKNWETEQGLSVIFC